MAENIISLREYIRSGKARTFLKFMEQVDLAMAKQHEQGISFVNVNLDQIGINSVTNEVIFPVTNTLDPYEKTIASYQTGVSLSEEAKRTKEHNQISFALMILGWYVSGNRTSIQSDIEALENYSEYMSKVPNWLIPFFDGKFRKLDTNMTFARYYNERFMAKINQDLRNRLGIDINASDFSQIADHLIHNINSEIKAELLNGQINEDSIFGFYEQYVLDKCEMMWQRLSVGSSQAEERSVTQQEKTMVRQLVKDNGFSPSYDDEYPDIEDNKLLYSGDIYSGQNKDAAFTNIVTLIFIIAIVLFVGLSCFLIFPYIF